MDKIRRQSEGRIFHAAGLTVSHAPIYQCTSPPCFFPAVCLMLKLNILIHATPILMQADSVGAQESACHLY